MVIRIIMNNNQKSGFSLIEIIVVIFILGVLTTVAVKAVGNFDKNLLTAAAMKDMKNLQKVIVDKVYPDMRYIPCGLDNPAKSRALESLFVPAYFYLQRGEFKDFFDDTNSIKSGFEDGYVPDWEKYESRGWQGPYLKNPTGVIDATYFNKDQYPEIDKSHIYLDTIHTPWAASCEEKAREVEADNPDLAKEYRKGKYYQILCPQITLTEPVAHIKFMQGRVFDSWKPRVCEIPKNSAYILCRGADCLPPENPLYDVAAYLECEAQIRENAVEKCISDEGKKTISSLKECVKDIYEQKYHICYPDGNPETLEKRLAVTDPENELYLDLGDDLLISVFGKIIRSPMDDPMD